MRGKAALGGALAAMVIGAAPALAGHPIGNSNYIAVDKEGRPAITLWMKTKTTMYIFACYHWGPGPRHGDHLNNTNRITVKRDGTFSYNGPAANSRTTVTIHLSGHFVSGQVATGVLTAPCMKHHRFTARRG